MATSTHDTLIDNKQLEELSESVSRVPQMQLRPQHLLRPPHPALEKAKALFEEATLQQKYEGKQRDELTEEQQEDLTATARLNMQAVAILAATGLLTAQAIGGLLRNTSMIVDNAMAVFTRGTQANTTSQQPLPPTNDPNSPASLLSAMQNGDGSLLVNVLADSLVAAQQNNDLILSADNQAMNQQTADEEHAEEMDHENLINAEHLQEDSLKHESQESHTHQATPTPKPAHGTSNDDDDQAQSHTHKHHDEKLMAPEKLREKAHEAHKDLHHIKDAAHAFKEMDELKHDVDVLKTAISAFMKV